MSLQVTTQEALADLETPVSTYVKLCRHQADSFLLESVEAHESVGRYSIIAWDPLLTLTLWPGTLEVRDEAGTIQYPADDFFNRIKVILKEFSLASAPKLPAVGSLMGYVGYDAIRLIEPSVPARAANLPTARLVFPSRIVVFDRSRRIMTLVGLDKTEDQAQAKTRDTASLLAGRVLMPARSEPVTIQAPPRDHYVNAVERAKEYIRAGDIFQVVLADRYQGRTKVDPFSFYRYLRVRSPSPYMFFLNFGGFHIAGASPETMVKVKDRTVTLRPIAGTRPRSEDTEEDLALEKELLASEKERAEHLMLVDLARNDAGRVAVGGSVTVKPYMTVERYSHVMHIVSQVQGRLRDDVDPVDAFQAGFPAGTVSGAPKVRAMQIIDELEQHPRGPYSGAIGYFGPGAQTDTCIGIRLTVFEEDRFTIPVGAGIVADSDPEMEYQEIGHKAAQSLAALRAAGGSS